MAELDDEQRLDALKAFARGKEVYLAVWAVRALAREPNPDAIAFLRNELTTDSKATVDAQVVADMELRKQPGWLHSQEQLELFNRWAGSKLTDAEGSLASSPLQELTQRRGAVEDWQEDLLPIIRTAVNNDGLSIRVRKLYIWIASQFGNHRRGDDSKGDDQPTFDFLLEVVRESPEFDLKLAAAKGLENFHLDSVRREAVTQLIDSADDTTLKAALENMLVNR